MDGLTYELLLNENDVSIPQLKVIYRLPEISRYISISDNYFLYVTRTTNVYFYKVHSNGEMIGAMQLEKHENLLYMDIMIFPQFQRMGVATKVIKDIQNDIFKLDYEKIEISIDNSNVASIKLFENAGFTQISRKDELINFAYQRRTD